MEIKDIDVECPGCKGHILVDTRTGRILRFRHERELDDAGKPKVTEGDWDAADKKVGQRLQTAEERFDEGLGREVNRGKDLDDLFNKASEKLKQEDPDD